VLRTPSNVLGQAAKAVTAEARHENTLQQGAKTMNRQQLQDLYVSLYKALKALDAHITALDLDYGSVEKQSPEWVALMARNNLRTLTADLGMQIATGGG
jgi:hypothetical protein